MGRPKGSKNKPKEPPATESPGTGTVCALAGTVHMNTDGEISMMKAPRRLCETCTHADGPIGGWMRCHRYPADGGWPRVPLDGWCGEWRARA